MMTVITLIILLLLLLVCDSVVCESPDLTADINIPENDSITTIETTITTKIEKSITFEFEILGTVPTQQVVYKSSDIPALIAADKEKFEKLKKEIEFRSRSGNSRRFDDKDVSSWSGSSSNTASTLEHQMKPKEKDKSCTELPASELYLDGFIRFTLMSESPAKTKDFSVDSYDFNDIRVKIRFYPLKPSMNNNSLLPFCLVYEHSALLSSPTNVSECSTVIYRTWQRTQEPDNNGSRRYAKNPHFKLNLIGSDNPDIILKAYSAILPVWIRSNEFSSELCMYSDDVRHREAIYMFLTLNQQSNSLSTRTSTSTSTHQRSNKILISPASCSANEEGGDLCISKQL